MRGSSEISPAAAAFELALEDDSRPLDLATVFGRVAPLEVDLGCGDGAFLTAMAAENPSRDYLGVERMFGRVRGACKRIARLGLTNARILRVEIPHAVEQLLPAASVDVFHLLFPDPWPKRRHHCRRVFTGDLLRAVARALTPDGTFRVATDDVEYFQEMRRVLRGVEFFAASTEPPISSPLPGTTFEKRFVERGLEIHRLVLRKVSEPR